MLTPDSFDEAISVDATRTIVIDDAVTAFQFVLVHNSRPIGTVIRSTGVHRHNQLHISRDGCGVVLARVTKVSEN